ncbi:MAG: lysozyme inhibitor LprI family protein [Telluria sp.]
MKTTLSILLLAASSMCSAAEPVLSSKYDACMNKADGATESMLSCIGAETGRQDAQLNTAYKEVMAATPKDRQAKLREAQRNWIKFRDTNCAFYADPNAGTAAALDGASCVMTMTAERAHKLGQIEAQMSAR